MTDTSKNEQETAKGAERGLFEPGGHYSPRSRPRRTSMTVKERLARMEGMLSGAWWSLSNLSRGLLAHTSNETVMRLVAETMDEVRAMRALGVEVLNVDCDDPTKKALIERQHD